MAESIEKHTDTDLTIGIPVYNGAEGLAATLDNLLAQTYQNFQIIISNNGSQDDTAQICDDYAKRDPRIRVFHQSETTNPTENFRFVLDKADTPYFMWSAHDDTRDPDFIEKLINALKSDSSTILAFGDILQYIDGEEVPLKLDFANNERSPSQRLYWTATKQLHHLYGIWRTDVLQSIQWQHTNWWHDTPLMMAACLMGDFKYVPGVKLHYLYNRHYFFNKGYAPVELIKKTGDLLHLIYQSGKTVGNAKGPVNGLMASACVSIKIAQQSVGFIKNRV